MRGEQLFEVMKEQLHAENGSDLAKRLGVTAASIAILKKNENVGERQIANFIKRVVDAKLGEQVKSAIDPIVEFFPIDKSLKRNGNDYLPFDTNVHPELKTELDEARGIYVFYNSEGQIIYLGKTEKNLYVEIVQTFNRKITRYKLYRVNHTKESYSSERAKPKIGEFVTYLFETAHYMSCYRVADGLISPLEAFGIRILPNNIVNSRMETLKTAKKVTS